MLNTPTAKFPGSASAFPVTASRPSTLKTETALVSESETGPAGPIFSDAVEHYQRSYLATETKSSTAKEKARNIKATFYPHFRDKPIGRITFAEIVAVLEHIRDVKKKPSASLHA